ncbi:Plasmodium exported protein, unknown function [Plasmodium ovale wallikeri]|uniref:Plasmodium RESA N-terminal domain-containing protein n=2 Tax=Plasmodium ovale TaxID=36330 RepID=A0A1A9AP93_PLAOA|nr:Plasmodium exported protein, unknown function [Plasmodium ovale wallikeri]SBT58051.1 Plasmodium exported protein, unknown function [Plasmodium ovale wallikeri]
MVEINLNKGINRNSDDKTDVYHDGVDSIFKRNLLEENYRNVVEQLQENPIEQGNTLTLNMEDTYELDPLDPNASTNTETLEEFVKNCEETFDEVFMNMANEYVQFTNDMNHAWCDKMWETRWCKYAQSLHNDIINYINDDTLSVNEKREIFQLLMTWSKNDFKYFLNLIKEEWDMRDDPEHYLER